MRKIIKSLPRLLKSGPQSLPLYRGRDWKEVIHFKSTLHSIPLNAHFVLRSWPKFYRIEGNKLGNNLLVLDGYLMEYAQYNGVLCDILHFPNNCISLNPDNIFIAKQPSVTLHTYFPQFKAND